MVKAGLSRFKLCHSNGMTALVDNHGSLSYRLQDGIDEITIDFFCPESTETLNIEVMFSGEAVAD